VAPNTPADRCYPKLNEGDHVMLINGLDVSPLSHEEVVNLIRNARDNSPNELVLVVRPNGMYTSSIFIIIIIIAVGVMPPQICKIRSVTDSLISAEALNDDLLLTLMIG